MVNLHPYSTEGMFRRHKGPTPSHRYGTGPSAAADGDADSYYWYMEVSPRCLSIVSLWSFYQF